MSKSPLFKVVFMNQGQVYEIYARSVGHGELFGFVEVEELVFGERTTVVVDPSEEKIARLETALMQAGLPVADAVPLFAALLSVPLPERYPPICFRQFARR